MAWQPGSGQEHLPSYARLRGCGLARRCLAVHTRWRGYTEQIAAAAIAARVPVFVEKPPAVTTAALVELADAAVASGVVTGVGMNFRWAAPVRHIRALLDSGAYGRPTTIALRHVANKPKAPMWGLSLLRSFLLAQVVHPVVCFATVR
jgi:predicted dehydrogenase